jgi:hypothetical protein
MAGEYDSCTELLLATLSLPVERHGSDMGTCKRLHSREKFYIADAAKVTHDAVDSVTISHGIIVSDT